MTTKSLVNAAMMIAIYLVFLILYTIGVFPTVISLLLPIPIIIYSLRSTKLSEICLLFLGCCLGAAIFTSVYGLLSTLIYGLSGVILGWGLVKKWPRWQRILNAAIIHMMGYPLMIYLLTGLWISDSIMEVFNESFALAENIMPEAIESLQTLQTLLTMTIPQLMPTILLLMGIVSSFLTDMVATIVLKRLNFDIPKAGEIKNFQLGRILAIIYLVSQAAFIFTNQATLNVIFINLVTLLNLLFTFQGIIVLFAIFNIRHKGIAIAIIAFLFLTNATLALSLLGVMDAILDYRERFKKREL